jgi:AraC-like DNA-binding protein
MLDRLSKEGSAGNIIAPAIRYIESNYQNPRLSNTELAEVCNISEVYFRKLFAEAYKTTPKQFILDIRINKAKQLLSEGIFKISAIAVQCGFTNQYHFCRIFKEKTGVTPSECIKRKRIYKI